MCFRFEDHLYNSFVSFEAQINFVVHDGWFSFIVTIASSDLPFHTFLIDIGLNVVLLSCLGHCIE